MTHNEPSPRIERRLDLKATLFQLGCYDDDREEDRRQALDILEQLLCQWSSSLLSNKDVKNDDVPRVSVVTFGSYRLGVHRPQSDMDVLALSPTHCSRKEFFSSLVEQLKSDKRITSLHSIPTAYTPVIKFLLNDTKIDLLFARLSDPSKLIAFQVQRAKSTTRLEYTIDDSDIVGLDEAGVRSVNGARVSQRLLELVPDVDRFRLVLRAIKAWADIHGVQSNVLGFLGGINWAIMVAWVCIQHTEADPPELLYLFFSTFARWKWPEPVTLGPICRDPPPRVTPLVAWDPEANLRDGLHVMPILTPSPAYPSMNSSYNVGISQLRRLQDEMYRAAYRLEATHCDCTQIFRRSDLFERHGNFLQIILRANTTEDLMHWSRLCETKLRLLFTNLETPDVNSWPFARFFERPNQLDEASEVDDGRELSNRAIHELYFFIALRFSPDVETIDLKSSVLDFLQKANGWEGRKPGMDLCITRISAQELPSFVLDDSGSGIEKDGLAGIRQAKRFKIL